MRRNKLYMIRYGGKRVGLSGDILVALDKMHHAGVGATVYKLTHGEGLLRDVASWTLMARAIHWKPYFVPFDPVRRPEPTKESAPCPPLPCAACGGHGNGTTYCSKQCGDRVRGARYRASKKAKAEATTEDGRE